MKAEPGSEIQHAQTVLTAEEITKLHQKAGTTSTKDALRKAVKHYFECESAVSPVVGVVLMVAITFVLAAVVALFVFGTTAFSANIPTEESTAYYYTDYGVTCIIQDKGTACVADAEIQEKKIDFNNIEYREVSDLRCNNVNAIGCATVKSDGTYLIEYVPDSQRCPTCPTINDTIAHEMAHLIERKLSR